MRLHIAGAGALATLMAFGHPALAQDVPEFRLVLKDHTFDPPELTVPAGVRLMLVVRNADPTPAEFESAQLNVEKIISAGREAKVRLGPLTPGRYAFMDDFNQQARGTLVVTKD